MYKDIINDINNNIDNIYNRNNISKVKLYISSDIITDIFENVPDTLVFKYKTPLNKVYQKIIVTVLNKYTSTMKEGKKNDFQDGKLRWDLLPLEEIEDIVKLYTAGSIKYGDNNWQGLENGYQRYKAAMLRHLLEYEKGNKIDEETKVNHLAAVAWNAIAMLYLDKHGKGKVNDNK